MSWIEDPQATALFLLACAVFNFVSVAISTFVLHRSARKLDDMRQIARRLGLDVRKRG